MGTDHSLDLDALIEDTINAELIAEADDRRLAEEITEADWLRIDRQRRREAFIALLLKITSRPRCHVSSARNAALAA